MRKLLLAVLCLFLARAAAAQTVGGQIFSAPIVPQQVPSTVYPPDTGYTLTAVASGANLQTAISAAACGTKLNLAHGGNWSTSSAYTLPNNSCACHTDPTKWQVIQSDAFEANYTPGVRLDPSTQYGNLAHIISTDPVYAFTANFNGSSCWMFAGVDVRDTNAANLAALGFGDGSFSVANMPHDFTVFWSYIHGGTLEDGTIHCIFTNGNWMTVVDSYISDCHRSGQDSQGILAFDGLGPWIYLNDFIEGATENTMFGGGGAQNLASDITMMHNHHFKPLAWKPWDPSYYGKQWVSKNSIEFKEGQHIYVCCSVFDQTWFGGQHESLIFNPGCDSGSTPPQANSISDVTITLNIMRNSPRPYLMGGCGDKAYHPPHKIWIHDNLSYNMDPCIWATCTNVGIALNSGAYGSPGGVVLNTYDWWIEHETISADNLFFGLTPQNGSIAGNGNLYYGMKFRNNIIGNASGFSMSAIAGQGQATGNNTYTTFLPGALLDHNCFYGTQAGTYSNPVFTGTQFPANPAAVFVNPGIDFHVAGTSACHAAASDGKDMGANIDAVLAATAGVVQPLGNLHTITNVSPTTISAAGGTTITITGTNFISGEAEVVVGGAGPGSTVSSVSCSVSTCTVVMATPITLAVNDTVALQFVSGIVYNGLGNALYTVASVTDSTHFTYTNTGIGTQSWSGGTLNRVANGNLCSSGLSVTSTTITCNVPAATGSVTTGLTSVFVSQFGIPVQSPVFVTYQ